ncbi:hypothetical protein ABZS88_26425 [Streptomyces sp. NPDC005480]|uniref:hypothetical protein n=1 Tax=Streptomyces sp. NPDC005480 TaxID=3154880 RepID=UPI0033AE7DF6
MHAFKCLGTMPHYGKDEALTGPDKEHAATSRGRDVERSMVVLHLLQSALVYVHNLSVQQGPWPNQLGRRSSRTRTGAA